MIADKTTLVILSMTSPKWMTGRDALEARNRFEKKLTPFISDFAKFTGGGVGMGGADLDLEVESSDYSKNLERLKHIIDLYRDDMTVEIHPHYQH